jgi:hypothetical protein
MTSYIYQLSMIFIKLSSTLFIRELDCYVLTTFHSLLVHSFKSNKCWLYNTNTIFLISYKYHCNGSRPRDMQIYERNFA